MRHNDLRQIFFFAFLIPYLVVLIFGFIVIKKAFSNLSLVEDLENLIYPLRSISSLIFYLNEDKVLKTLELFVGKSINFDNKKQYWEQIFQLEKHLRENKDWQYYCNCGDLLNLDQTLLRLKREKFKTPKGLLLAYDRLINQLCNYYSQLSSKLRLKSLSLELNTIYTLHKFWTVTSDFTAERLVDLKSSNRGFIYSYYYYRGELIAYADTFYTLTGDQRLRETFKREIYNSTFIRNLIEDKYIPLEDFLKEYFNFQRRFRSFHAKIFDHFLEKIQSLKTIYRSNLIFTILGEVFILISLGILNFILYLYGQAKYKRILTRLEKKAYKDPLTGLLNRRFFNTFMVKTLKKKYLAGEPVSFILLDLDHFKRINDTYGHVFGDKVLKHIAQILRGQIRRNDIAIRWGGEEFAIFVNGTLEDAKRLAERLRKTIENSPVDGVKITASFGVGEFKGGNPKEFFRRVDEALYRAKQKGRNRIEVVED